MKTWLSYIQEKLITFGGKAHPKNGQVVILAGGAGSGKGFQLSSLIGIEGKVFDVDELKKLVVKIPKFVRRIKDATGHDVDNFDMKNPDEVSILHDIIASTYNLPKRRNQAFFDNMLTSIHDKTDDHRPNLIFDVTLKGIDKLYNISRNVLKLGYKKENIHLVWVVNQIDIAIQQNAERDRVVHDAILLTTHEGASITMKRIMGMGNDLKQYMDGDIWLTFNQADVDTSIEKSTVKDVTDDKLGIFKPKLDKDGNQKKGQRIKNATYIKIKSKGKPVISADKLDSEIYDKIKAYVPKTDTW